MSLAAFSDCFCTYLDLLIEVIDPSAGKQVRIVVIVRCAWCVLRIEYIRIAIGIVFAAFEDADGVVCQGGRAV